MQTVVFLQNILSANLLQCKSLTSQEIREIHKIGTFDLFRCDPHQSSCPLFFGSFGFVPSAFTSWASFFIFLRLKYAGASDLRTVTADFSPSSLAEKGIPSFSSFCMVSCASFSDIGWIALSACGICLKTSGLTSRTCVSFALSSAARKAPSFSLETVMVTPFSVSTAENGIFCFSRSVMMIAPTFAGSLVITLSSGGICL